MAASPDIISGLLSDPNTASYLGAAMGLLGSSGASRLPVTMGAAMGNALGGSQQYAQQAIQNSLARENFAYQAMWMRAMGIDPLTGKPLQTPTQQLTDLSQGSPGPASKNQQQLTDLSQANPVQTALAVSGGATNPVQGALNSDIFEQNNLLNAITPQQQAQSVPNQQPQTSLPTSQYAPGYEKLSTMVPAGMNPYVFMGAMMKDPGRLASTMYSNNPLVARNVALARSTGHNLANQQVVLSPEQAAQSGLEPLPPGMSYQYNVSSHQVSTVGQPTTKQLQAYTAQGYPVKVPATITGTGGVQIVPGAYNLFSSIPGGLGIGGGAAPSSRVVPSASLSGSGLGGTSSVAQSIANNNAPFPSKLVGTPRGDILLHQILQLNPDWNMQQYAVAQNTLKAFATGTQGLAVKSFNVALQHLDTLNQLSQGLKNHDTRSMNSLVNMAKKQFGKSAPTAFDAAKQLVSDEIQKAVAGVPGGESERSQLMDNISSASSPEQLQGVINTFEKLMVGQLSGLQREYKSGTQRNDFSNRYLTPASRKLFSEYENQTSGDTSVNQAPPAAVAYLKTHPELRQQFQNKYGYLPE